MEKDVNLRGIVYLADLGQNIGSVQSGVRPVVVISNEKNNRFSTTLNVIPLTTRGGRLPVHVNIGKKCGLEQDSVALVEQSSTIDKKQVIKKIGKCSNREMSEIEMAMLMQTGISIDNCIDDKIRSV